MTGRLFVKNSILLFLLIVVGCQTTAQENECSKYPKPIGHVNDFEAVLTSEEISQLETYLREYEGISTVELAIVTTKSFEPDTSLFDYSLNLANCWGVGKASDNNGVLIAISMKQRAVRIQLGTGLEDVFTDEEAQVVVDEYLIPHFKKGLVYKGIRVSLSEIFKQLLPLQDE